MTPERRHWRRSGVFIVNYEHIWHLVLVFLLLTFKHVNAVLESVFLNVYINYEKFRRKNFGEKIEMEMEMESNEGDTSQDF